MIVERADQVGDLGDGLGELVPGDAGENGIADETVGTCWVEQDEACLVEQQRGAVQVLERAQASPLPGLLDAGEHRGDQLVEQVHDVIEGRSLLNLGESEKGRVTAGWGHPGDGLRPCRGGEPGQSLHLHGRHGGQVDWAYPQGPDLLEPLQCVDQARHADPGGGASEPFQGRLPGAFFGDQQCLQACRLPRFQGPCQGAPQPRSGPVADLGHQTGEHRDPRQQDLALDQPGRGQVEEDAGAFGTDPGSVGEPAGQGRGLGPLVEVAVAVAATNLGNVVPAHHTRRIALQPAGVGDAQLPGEVGHDAPRDLGGVSEESAQESHRAELHSEPEAGVIIPAPGDEAAVLVVEMEVAFKLGGRRLAGVATIASLLLPGQEIDGHPCPLS